MRELVRRRRAADAAILLRSRWPALRSWFWRTRQWRHPEVLVSCAGLLVFATWVAFFGGLGSASGLEKYSVYTANLERVTPEYGLHFLACDGAYFAVPEVSLSGRLRALPWLWRARHVAIALALLVTFALCPPVLAEHKLGALNRASDLLISSRLLKVALLYPLALFACLRLVRLDAAVFIVLVHMGLVMTTHNGWEKYYLPAVASLWLLRSLGPDLALRTPVPVPAPDSPPLKLRWKRGRPGKVPPSKPDHRVAEAER